MKARHLLILLGGLLAGVLADASRWALGTADWNALLPWVHDGGWADPNGLTKGLNYLLGLASAWVLCMVPGKRGWVMLIVAVVLCFTGASAVALHDVKFDPFPPVLALLLGAGVAWLWHRQQTRALPDLAQIFAGQLSPEALSQLESAINKDELGCENRPVWLLGACFHEASTMRKKMGPSAFLTLTGEFRKRATAILLTRQALVLPGTGEIVWAAFGVPLASADAGAICLDSAELLRTALSESFPAPAEFSYVVQHGMAASGIVDGAYQVSGEVMDHARQLLEVAFLNQIVTDEPSAKLLLEDAAPLAQTAVGHRSLFELRMPPLVEAKHVITAEQAPPKRNSNSGSKPKKKRR